MATTDKCNRVVSDGADAFNYTSLFEVNIVILRLSQPQNTFTFILEYKINEKIPKRTNFVFLAN